MHVTEKKWRLTASWLDLESVVRARRFHRRQRLFGCACCRRLWHLLPDPASRAAVEIGERFADGEIGKTELAVARKAANRAVRGDLTANWTSAHSWAASAVEMTTHATQYDAFIPASVRASFAIAESGITTEKTERKQQTTLFRDIFGNPFRPVAFDPRWRSESAVALARTAYDTRNFSLLPILADALEEVGCDHPDVLTHCRDPRQVHVRGCWVVDLVLNKS